MHLLGIRIAVWPQIIFLTFPYIWREILPIHVSSWSLFHGLIQNLVNKSKKTISQDVHTIEPFKQERVSGSNTVLVGSN